MDNFTNVTGGYNKQEVNEFVEYVIKKTEDNILTIKKQKEEIENAKKEIVLKPERFKKEETFSIHENQKTLILVRDRKTLF